MKIEKLPSGSYRIRKMYKGETHTIVFDYKPTQKEAMQAMAVELDKVKCAAGSQLTFFKAAESYVDTKRNVLSPRTIKIGDSRYLALTLMEQEQRHIFMYYQ